MGMITGAEKDTLLAWIPSQAAKTLIGSTEPGMVSDAPLSKAVRFRWFEVQIGAYKYTFGLNLHTDRNWGSCWFKRMQDAEEMTLKVPKGEAHFSPLLKSACSKWEGAARTAGTFKEAEKTEEKATETVTS
ncbi:hypothetical protein [Mitsuaria sp. GD03876]|uniref:hypothetical protein n=1 Tax=Mitsuaria sp. GD03876 TaxID=2975399 RepID=UPI00244AD944|nr:hypothetical protein [Mitsuaria sp. GD03876]MDH0867381.1 hypothetical protein [Mitsuaria sp. GD03876]